MSAGAAALVENMEHIEYGNNILYVEAFTFYPSEFQVGKRTCPSGRMVEYYHTHRLSSYLIF